MIENNISKLLVITVSNVAYVFILSNWTVLFYDSFKGSIVNPVIIIFFTYPLTSCITLKNQKIPKIEI